MKQRKILSIIISFCLIFTFLFVDTAQAMESSSSSPTSSVSYGDYMYYTIFDDAESCGSIYKVNINTKQNTLIKKTNTGSFANLVVKDGWIYYEYITPDADSYIYKIRTNGTGNKLLNSGSNPTIYNNSIYYIKYNPSNSYYPLGIYKMSLSGTNNVCVKKTSTVYDFIVYQSNIYYITYSGSTNKNYLRKTNLSGSTSKILTSTSGFKISSLSAYSGYIYFDYGRDIYRIKTSSTTKSKFISNASMMDFYNGYIYYTVNKYDMDYIYKMNLSTKTKTYITKKDFVLNIDVAKGYMLIDYSTRDSYSDNCFIYLCTTSGKKGKVINSYYII